MTDRADRADLERRLRASLHAMAPPPAPDFPDRLFQEVAVTPQRRAGWNWTAALALAGSAAVVAAAVVVGIQLGRLLPVTPEPGQPLVTATGRPASPSPSAEPSPFANGQRCENQADGYAVSYPADWYANEAVADPGPGLDPVPACLMFGPQSFEVRPNSGAPPGATIVFQRVPEAPPVMGRLVQSEEVTIDGRPARVREFEAAPPYSLPAGSLVYQYLIELDDGDVLLVGTHSAHEGDYAERRDVLDRMMRTLDFPR